MKKHNVNICYNIFIVQGIFNTCKVFQGLRKGTNPASELNKYFMSFPFIRLSVLHSV